MGVAEPVTVTAYDGKRQDMLGTYEVDPAGPDFIIDGSEQRSGHIGHSLVLEYGSAIPSNPDEPAPEKDSPGKDTEEGNRNFKHFLKQFLLKALLKQRGQ